MRKLVAIVRPFERFQTVYVYEDSNKIDQLKVALTDLNNTIFSLSEEYSIKDITLIGSKHFNQGIQKGLMDAELQKYNKSNFVITLI